MIRPLYIVLSGLPGSGKSTIGWYLRRELEDTGRHVYYASTDLLIDQYALRHGVDYNTAFKPAIDTATTCVAEKTKWHILLQDTIIHDQTNLSVGKRHTIIDRVPSSYDKISIHVVVSEEERQRRLNLRIGKTIPKNVDRSMQAMATVPTAVEGFDLLLNQDNFVEGLKPYLSLDQYIPVDTQTGMRVE